VQPADDLRGVDLLQRVARSGHCGLAALHLSVPAERGLINLVGGAAFDQLSVRGNASGTAGGLCKW
jgi:hypothetical protein